MRRHRVAVILGTRPEAIKLAPIILGLRQDKAFLCRVCLTAQHRQMLDQVLEGFNLTADADLDVMRPNQTLSELTARLLNAIDPWLVREQPDFVLVQGDTTTVLAATLGAFYRGIPVGHVEAGLRTGSLAAPWPEEANRVLTSRLACLHFAPTRGAAANLRREGIPRESIFITGNPVIDALFLTLERLGERPPIIAGLPPTLQPRISAGGSLGLQLPRCVLITGHRRENFGAGLDAICRAIRRLARRFPAVHFVYPVHLNPRVREPVLASLRGPETAGRKSSRGVRAWARALPNIHLIEPLPYLAFVGLLQRCSLVLTDSGGIQEEAPSLGKPVLVMRDSTERPEAVKAGTVRLVGTDADRIVAETSRLLTDTAVYGRMARARNPYGDGRAAGRVIAACRDYLRARQEAKRR